MKVKLYFKQVLIVNNKKIERNLVSYFENTDEAEERRDAMENGEYNDLEQTLTFERIEEA